MQSLVGIEETTREWTKGQDSFQKE